MSRAVDELRAELAQLPPQDRAELAHYLIHSLDDEAESNVEIAWTDEIARRAEEIIRGAAKGEPADKVIAELREKYS